jgi:hypothetical protein
MMFLFRKLMRTSREKWSIALAAFNHPAKLAQPQTTDPANFGAGSSAPSRPENRKKNTGKYFPNGRPPKKLSLTV